MVVEGARIEEDIWKLIYNPLIANESYEKCYVNARGEYQCVTAPVVMLLDTQRWKYWELKGKNNRHLYLAYNPSADRENPWWQMLESQCVSGTRIPDIKGAFVLFRFCGALHWSEHHLFAQLHGFLHSPQNYIFSVEEA